MKKTLKFFLILKFIFLVDTVLFAEHIVSGVMYYEYLGPGSMANTNMYQITLKLFTDCNIDKTIEGNIDIGIYKGSPGNYAFVLKRTAFLGGSPSYSDFSGSCSSLLRNVCVGAATYVTNIELPETSGNYLIAYQRCCRNMTISNIMDPGRTGSTILMELTPESFRAKNSSPKFESNLPTIACVNEPLAMDLGGVDAENDSIAYELCAPLTGGGPRGSGGTSGDPNDCLGITPNPQNCIPTLKEVVFAGNFKFNSPFPSTTPIVISNNRLMATPNTLGQYTFGVCVKEYKNGVLMSVQRRDIQINFSACNITIKAAIQSAEVKNNIAFLTNCDPSAPFKITNLSTDTNFIKKINWEFTDPKGNKIVSDSFHFNRLLPDTGVYRGKMVLNRGNQCSDSINVQINVGQKISSGIGTASPIDTCSLGPFTFVQPLSTLSKIASWDFGDGFKSDSISNIVHSYSIPGTYTIKLTVSNDAQCSTSISKIIRLYPVPSEPMLKKVDTLICYPGILKLGLTNLSDSTYSYVWSFSDNRLFQGASPSIPITAPGNLSVKISITSPSGCKINKDFGTPFKIAERPKAAFIPNETLFTLKNATLILKNESVNANRYKWSFGDSNVSSDFSPSHTYEKAGVYNVILEAFSANGCIDSAILAIRVGENTDFFVPNIFSPNGDGVNDVFKPELGKNNINDYSLTVLNRWGDVVFKSFDPSIGWDGSNRKGKSAPIGVYVYQILFSVDSEATKVVKGSVTLIR